jgi:anti-sigma regulatory factor (Ser/Thr protein kinase)
MKKFNHLIIFSFFIINAFSQTNSGEWRVLPIERLPPDKRPLFYQILCSSSGSLILSSTHGLINFQGFRINFPSVSIIANDREQMEKVKDPHTEDGIRSICPGNGSNFFFLTAGGRIYYMDENLITLTGWSNPPLYIPVNIPKDKTISSIWADKDGDLFVGIKNDSIVIIPGIAKRSPSDGEMNKEGNFIFKDIISKTRKIFISGNPDVFAITNDIVNDGAVLLATSKGLARLKKKTGEIIFLGQNWNDKIKITNIQSDPNGNIWFGTVGYGMGMYEAKLNEYFYYDIATKTNKGLTINSFCRKSGNEFFVAVADSLPAIFNITDHSFTFITDTIFNRSKNNTTDIKVNGFGNLFTVKGGALFYSNSFSSSKEYANIKLDSDAYAPFIYDMQINHRPYFELIKGRALSNTEEIQLKYNQNQLDFNYSLLEFWNQSQTITEWKLDGLNMDWVPPIPDPEKFKAKFIPPLSPGKYVFRVRAKVGNEAWRKQEAALIIIIAPPFWQTWWFWTIVAASLVIIITFFYRRHIFSVRKKEREKVIHEKELVELEAKALRAQMNPHFVFNSLNSIKSLINKNDNEKAAGYLSTFSKLIRTLFQNSDKREVSLYEELETCKLYTQLEKMRFGDKVEFIFDVDESIDLKDFKVPALILQPFIENAIWHGLMPKETGGKIIISVKKVEGAVQCIIDDDGIGRELSMKSKPKYEPAHQSRGIGLTQSRLELDKLLNEREDKIFIIDKENENGTPEGTKVIISFKEV